MKLNKSKIILSSIFLIMLTIGCSLTSQPSVTKNPKQDYPKIYQRIKDDLENGYHEKFAINKIRYISETDVYVAYCNPIDNREFVFEARTGGHKYGNYVWDRYGSERMDYEVEKYYNPFLEELFPYKKAINVNFATMTNWGRVPSAKEMIEEDSENTKIYVIMHVFENVIENNKEKFLKNVLKLKETLKKQDLKRDEQPNGLFRKVKSVLLSPLSDTATDPDVLALVTKQVPLLPVVTKLIKGLSSYSLPVGSMIIKRLEDLVYSTIDQFLESDLGAGDGFYAAAFVNRENKEIIIAHRGTNETRLL